MGKKRRVRSEEEIQKMYENISRELDVLLTYRNSRFLGFYLGAKIALEWVLGRRDKI